MKITSEMIIHSLIAAILLGFSIVLSLRKIRRTGGTVLKHHIVFFLFVAAIVVIVPIESRRILFSPMTVSLIGNILPVIESIRAVCTPSYQDDKIWLQYWIAQSVVIFGFEWVGYLTDDHTQLYDYFFTFEFFYFCWLMTPFTDGAALIHKYISLPILTPMVKPLEKRCVKQFAFLTSAAVSVGHIYVVVLFFLFLPVEIQRFVTIAAGTVYPTFASLKVSVSPLDSSYNPFWLTYWSGYGMLFVIMDSSETFFGNIPGFYAVILICTVYLMVPIFNGAEKVFRNILVPLAGQHEMLVYRDAVYVKMNLNEKCKEDRLDHMNDKIKHIFSVDINELDMDNDQVFGTEYFDYFRTPLLPDADSNDDSSAGDKNNSDDAEVTKSVFETNCCQKMLCC